MNNKNGIEIKCDNCTHHCRKDIDNLCCQHGDFYAFLVSRKALEARIAELESISIMSKNDDKIDTIKKRVDFVKPIAKRLTWVDTNNKTRSDCRLGNLWICVYAAQWTPDPNLDLWFIGHSDSSEQCIDSLSHIDNNATNLEEAKRCAQDWLVSLVANVCESEVRNG